MYGRSFNVAVVLLWLVTMTWLVWQKVLPPLRIGDPPDYERILEAKQNEPPVGWELLWNGRPLGWALSTTRPLPDHSTEIRSRVHFDAFPVSEMTPGWLRSFLQVLDKPSMNMETDAYTTLSISPLGYLTQLRTSIAFAPLVEAISMEGTVEGSRLQLSLHSRDVSYRTDVAVDPESLLGSSLSPQTQLPGLREGQTWTVEVCSPLRYPNHPVEVLQARVEGLRRLHHDDRDESVWLVVYHEHSGMPLGGQQNPKPRGRLWVRPDGTVLRQELMLFGSRMAFHRMPEHEAAALARRLGVD